ncbi:hypothetical protein CR513_09195, partial [Mucuna pruriens]
MLPYALHEYCTSIRTSTGATPYSLVYGTEAVLPIEVKIPSLRVLVEVELEDAEWIQSWLNQLNLIDEKQLTTLCHEQLYQKIIKSDFDKKSSYYTLEGPTKEESKRLIPKSPEWRS